MPVSQQWTLVVNAKVKTEISTFKEINVKNLDNN